MEKYKYNSNHQHKKYQGNDELEKLDEAKKNDNLASRYKKEIMDSIKKNSLKLVFKIFKMSDAELSSNLEQEFSNPAEVVADTLPSFGKINWEFYIDSSSYIVKNVKNKGYPDWDKVFTLASKQANVRVEAIEDYCNDQFCQNLWFDQIYFYVENIDIKNYTIVGRSNGYHGVEYTGNELILDEKKVKKEIENFLKKYKFNADDFDDFSQVESFTKHLNETISSVLSDIFDDYFFNNVKDLEDYVAIDSKVLKEFENLGKSIEENIVSFEKPDIWADLIVVNEYWNEELAMEPLEYLKKEYSIDDEYGKAILELLKDQGFEVSDISNINTAFGINLEIGNEQWLVASEDEAYELAKQYLDELIDDMGITGFNESFWMAHIDTERLGRDLAMDSYMDRELGTENPENYLDEEPAGESGDWSEEQIERAGDLAEETYVENVTNDPIGYLEDIYGDIKEFRNLEDYIDVEELIEDAIATDGIAHNLSTYDGKEYEYGNLLAYRQD